MKRIKSESAVKALQKQQEQDQAAQQPVLPDRSQTSSPKPDEERLNEISSNGKV